ncbi:MAG: FAD/FMN-containing dehydrogenase, partial [Desulfobacterales bacterium]|nr:FAD/FMN-containing dehydrogenase [Desulfobacterales bacterium]
YGVTRDYVLGLEAVLPTGEIIRAGVRTRKGVVGYDLAHLLVGSEGSLAVITGLTLKLIPHPPAVRCMCAAFPDLPSAMRAVTAIQVRGCLPSAIEFMDHKCLERASDLLPFKRPGPGASLLIIEVDGVDEWIAREIENIGGICKEFGAADALAAQNEKEREMIWEMRRQTSSRIHDAAPVYIPEDVVVPIARIADLVSALPAFEKKYGLDIFAFGHAGDGNIHLNITAPARDYPGLDACVLEILKLVVKMDGAISGEHGVGVAKKAFMPLELSAASLALQRGVKKLFDPANIMNTGKVF